MGSFINPVELCLVMKNQEKVNGWKIAAIIFLILVILESSLIVWAIREAIQSIKNENECSINICANYDSYIYDDYEKMCYCYKDHEIVYMEFIK